MNEKNIVLSEFDKPWRGGSPVFACCRKTVDQALSGLNLSEVAKLDVAERVQTLRSGIDPVYLDSHRCCMGHLADVAFDLPHILEKDCVGSK